MVTITTSTQSPEEVREALRSRGLDVEEPTPGESKESGSSEQSGKSGEDSATAKTGESASASDAEGKESQGNQAEGEKPSTEQPKRERPGRHNFKSRVEQAENRILKLSDDLEMERGDSRRLKEQLAAARAELDALKGTQEKPKVDEGPVKPVRPTLADCEFDQEKYDLAMADYDEKLIGYSTALAKKQVADELAQKQREADEKAAAAARQAEIQAFRERCAAEIELLPDYKELAESMPTEAISIGDHAEDAIEKSDHPALLIHYFMTDVVDNGGKESERFRNMHPVIQVREITKLEQKLVSELKKPATTTKEEPAKPAVVTSPASEPDKTPARQKPVARVPESPIEPVGSRSGRAQASLDQASSVAEYWRLRKQGVSR